MSDPAIMSLNELAALLSSGRGTTEEVVAGLRDHTLRYVKLCRQLQAKADQARQMAQAMGEVAVTVMMLAGKSREEGKEVVNRWNVFEG